MLGITQAKYVDNYQIWLLFNNGQSGEVDLKETIFNDKRTIFAPLKEIKHFKNFKLEHQTLTWFNELDFAPEFLFFQAFKNNKEMQNKFKTWGYTT